MAAVAPASLRGTTFPMNFATQRSCLFAFCMLQLIKSKARRMAKTSASKHEFLELFGVQRKTFGFSTTRCCDMVPAMELV
mmetsp:Transcript_32389/g.60987  ORF Transcript_32389/g.60987 Transcript_32389/m.60987 type:complete len:80 (-) Transcript_32389:220-459(-)